jgi:dihydropyrimidine dehydrogenase (NAD+) subunit PreA
VEWKNLDLNYKIVARIHPEKCIGCELCYTACWDGAHQCIHLDRGIATPAASASGKRRPRAARIAMTPIAKLDGATGNNGGATPPGRIPRVDEDECVGCNLCALVCPVDGCITMDRVDTGRAVPIWEQRMTAIMSILIRNGTVVTAESTRPPTSWWRAKRSRRCARASRRKRVIE